MPSIIEASCSPVSTPREEHPFVTEAASLGESRGDLDRALQVVAELEDDDLLRRMRAGS